MSMKPPTYITHREQIKRNPSLLRMETWEGLDSLMTVYERNKAFLKNKNIVAHFLDGNSITDTAKKYNVSVSKVYTLLDRTLGANNDHEAPMLAKGLIPNAFINKRGRSKALSKHDDRVGSRGAFEYLLNNVKGLKKHLDEHLKSFIERKPNSENLKPSKFHSYFKDYLEVKKNWPKFKYPFNTDSKASESCRQYYHKRLMELKMPKRKSNRIIYTAPIALKAYQEIQLDAQIMDVETAIAFFFRGREILLRVSRITLYIARDKATGCILSYHLSFTKHPNRYDVLKLLTNIHMKWSPMELTTPGLEYTPGACLPSSLGDTYQSIGFGIVRLDNAMAHLANIVREYLTEDLKVTMNLGLPATPKARNIAEQIFKDLNYYWQSFQSTTGSHVRDPNKETKKNRKKPPVLTIQALEEIVSVVITNENVTPKELLGSKTPLEALKEDVQNFPLWINYDQTYKNKNPFLSTKVVPVKTIKHENRTPHINFMKMRYKGNCLINPDLVGKKIIIQIDSRDIRTIKATTLDGKYLGVIKCPMSWQIFPLSLTTKQQVMKLVRIKKINSKDPLAGYFIYLLNNKHLPHIALELYKLVDHSKLANKELTDAFTDDLEDEKLISDDSESNDDCFSSIDIPDWNQDLMHDE